MANNKMSRYVPNAKYLLVREHQTDSGETEYEFVTTFSSTFSMDKFMGSLSPKDKDKIKVATYRKLGELVTHSEHLELRKLRNQSAVGETK